MVKAYEDDVEAKRQRRERRRARDEEKRRRGERLLEEGRSAPWGGRDGCPMPIPSSIFVDQI